MDKETAILMRFMLATGARISEAIGIEEQDVLKVGKEYEINLKSKGGKSRRVRWHRKPIIFGGKENRTTVTNRIRRASLKAINRIVSAQDLRYTFNTRMMTAGNDFKAVRKFIGQTKSPGASGIH